MEYPQAIVSIVMLCVCLLLGVPVWWSTTKVYRATLPHSRINELQDTTIELDVELNFVSDQRILGELEKLNDFLEQFQSFRFKITKSSRGYERISKKTGNEVASICDLLPETNSSKRLKFNIVLLDSQRVDKFWYYCQSGFSYVVSSSTGTDGELTTSLKSLLREILPLDEVTLAEKQNMKTKTKVDVTKSLQLTTGYNLVFTLAVADPSKSVPSWDIQHAITEYLDPLLARLDFLGPFHVSSQVLYFADVGVKPRKSSDDNSFYYTKSKLPLIMNPLESRLNTYTSTDAGLNFIVYVPPPEFAPLYIKSTKSSSKVSKAFHSPRWGGILIHNNMADENETFIDTSDYMKVFMTQFLILNGLDADTTRTLFDKNTKETLTQSMRTRLLISKTFEHLQASISTLSSLSNLLDDIANIVIRDDIKELIETSVSHIDSALSSMGEGDITSALLSSKVAFKNSEKAFYDWTLLSLLYFPDDQKYAIYVPLFLPISLPIVISFYKAVRWLRSTE